MANTATEAPKVVKATVTVLASDKIEIRQDCEYAAWYTLWRVLPGTYTLERTTGAYWPHKDKPLYVAKVNAEIVQDYYGAHLGGVAVTKYDIHQNAGKRGHVTLMFTPMQVLKHQAVTLADEDYDALLVEACQSLQESAETSFRCIREDMGEANGGRRSALEWVSGHAESLAQDARLYQEFNTIQGRRAYDRKYREAGDLRWVVEGGVHADRTNRNWVGSAY